LYKNDKYSSIFAVGHNGNLSGIKKATAFH
jgi:hypothetical protein